MNRLPEPREDWTRITFEYEVEGIKLLPPKLRVDRFVFGDEIDLDPWTLIFSGELWNGGEPDLTCIQATRFDGERQHSEPIKGALAAHIEEFIADYLYTQSMRAQIKDFALDNGTKHFRRSAA